MPRLPGDPSLEHLKSQAKTLLAGTRAGDEAALRWVREYHPGPPAQLKLADAQLVVARAYGFPSWPKLHAHLDVVERFKRSPHTRAQASDPVDEFLRLACLTYSQDDPARWAAAERMLTPEIARGSLHAAAAAGDVEATRVLLSGDDARAGRGAARRGDAASAPDERAAAHGRANAANALGGPHRWEPLLYLAYSRVPTGDPLAVARLLLEAGADPDAGFLWEGLVPPFTALTGAFGHGEGDPPPHRDSLALARLLLEAGADPNDAQAVYNLSWTPGDAWLELLLEFGFATGDGGPWRARLGSAQATPRENAEDCLMWAAHHGFAYRVSLLLDAGVDPDGRGTEHPILHGRSALEVAVHNGHADTADALRAAGAREPQLAAADEIAAAYMRADPSVSAPPPPGLIARAAEFGRADAVALLLERGADVNAMPGRATALHEAALRGDRPLVDLLLAAGADPSIRDPEFDADAAGWATHAGHHDLATHLTV